MNDLIPDFNKMTHQEVKNYLHIPKRRKCISCKGSMTGSKNTLKCVGCVLEVQNRVKKLELERKKFDEFCSKQDKKLSFNELVKLYELKR